MRRFLVALLLVGAFALFLLVPEEPRGEWLDDGSGELSEYDDPGLIDDGLQLHQTLSGHVLDVRGEPVVGVVVRLEHAWVPEVRAATDAEGYFELTPDEPRGELTLSGSEWFLLGGERSVTPSRTEGYLLAVAPPRSLIGRVVDTQDRPIKDAELLARTPPGALVPLGVASLPIQSEGQTALTNRAGNFRLGPIPAMDGLEVEVRAEGYLPKTVSLPAAGEQLVIALEPDAE